MENQAFDPNSITGKKHQNTGNIEFKADIRPEIKKSIGTRKFLIISIIIFFIIIGGVGFFIILNKNIENRNTASLSNIEPKIEKTESNPIEPEEKKLETKKEPKWDIQENLLFEIPKNNRITADGTVGYYNEPNIYFSEDGTEFEYRARNTENNEWTSIVRGQKGGWIANPENIFKRNITSGNFIKIKPIKKGKLYNVVYKGRNLGEMGTIPDVAVVSADEKQYAYVTINDKTFERFVVINGEKGPAYKMIGMQSCSLGSHAETCDAEFAFAYDGEQNAYIAQKSLLSYTVVLNGKELEKNHREIHFIQFSFDNKHFAYKALDDKPYVVIDGEDQKKYDGIYNVRFNKDGTLTYDTILDNKIYFVTQRLKIQ